KHNLLSVQKLTDEQRCKVVFHSQFCLIYEDGSEKVRGVGKAKKGMYFLINKGVDTLIKGLKEGLKIEKIKSNSGNKMMAANTQLRVPATLKEKGEKLSPTTLWHFRMGHAPLDRIDKVEGLKGFDIKKAQECVACPMAKFTRQPFKLSTNRAKASFKLIHIDTWGPYKVKTREGHRYFLTVVDDYSRTTWIHLLKYKDEAYSVITQFVKLDRNSI
ncbi:Retrovirus-related Pol polyprotein from transposon TNT 1-94, partial [Bienertia sinuspersici]